MANRYWAAVLGLQRHRDVLAEVALGEGCKGGALRLRLPVLGVLAGAHAGDDERGAPARLRASSAPMTP